MDNAKIWKVLVNHDPIVIVGDVIVLQEKIEPLFSSPCLKIAITQKKHLLLVNDLYFHTYGEFSPPSVCPPPSHEPKSWSRGPNPSLVAQILASKPKSWPGG